MSQKDHIYSVILAGGSGTRLWPLSRELSPKQLFRFFGTKSLIYRTIERVLPLSAEERTLIVTNDKLEDEIMGHLLSEELPFSKVTYLVEPASKNTAPAIGLAAAVLRKRDPEAIAIVLPSDHVVEAGDLFNATLETAISLAKSGYLATIGLTPVTPETGFGYIKTGTQLDIEGARMPSFAVEAFVEKPDLETAMKYVESAKYFWNSGMFVFKCSDLLAKIQEYKPELFEVIEWMAAMPSDEWSAGGAKERFESVESISLDYAVMERADNVAVVPTTMAWNDVGSVTALEEFLDHDEQGNVLVGNALQVDSKDSLIYGDKKRLVALLGMKDVVVIDTHDATLIMPKERAQDVRKVVDLIKSTGRQEHLTHRTTERPWGKYTILEEGQEDEEAKSGPLFKIKIIEVKVGGRLSRQLHHHRSEHWVVLSGMAKVSRGDHEIILRPNESTFISIGEEHRLENIGKIPLKIIEVQSGEYLSEDDIVRLSDVYDR